jgi:hypothetical protein
VTSQIVEKYPNYNFTLKMVENFMKEFSNQKNLVSPKEEDFSTSTSKKRKDFTLSYCKICGSSHRNHPDYEEKCKKKKLDPVKSTVKKFDEIVKNYEAPKNPVEYQLDHPMIVTKLDDVSIRMLLSPIDVQIDPVGKNETEMILEKSLNCFISSLIHDSLKIMGPNESNEKVLVPTHVYSAIMKNFEKYAFLWNFEK